MGFYCQHVQYRLATSYPANTSHFSIEAQWYLEHFGMSSILIVGCVEIKVVDAISQSGVPFWVDNYVNTINVLIRFWVIQTMQEDSFRG